MVIFHSYVKLPEGKLSKANFLGASSWKIYCVLLCLIRSKHDTLMLQMDNSQLNQLTHLQFMMYHMPIPSKYPTALRDDVLPP